MNLLILKCSLILHYIPYGHSQDLNQNMTLTLQEGFPHIHDH